MTAIKNEKNIKKENPTKLPSRVLKQEKEESRDEGGETISPTKKRSKGIVALKHNRVFKSLTKNIGKSKKKPSMYQAMIDQGYSPSYARASQLNKTKSWNQLMEEYLPDNLLATTHNDLLLASKLDYMLFTADMSDESIYELLSTKGIIPKKIIHGIQGTHVWFFLADNKIRKDATELAYKIKGKMAPDEIKITGTLQQTSDEELAAIIKRQTAKLCKTD